MTDLQPVASDGARTPPPPHGRIAVVLGASGYMGSNLVPALAAHGWRVRAVARNAAVLEAREWAGVECWSADVLQPDTLAPVLEGADVVFYLVHMMWSGGDFVPVERRAAENARRACEDAGVRRIVYLGGIMPKAQRSRHMEGRAVVGDALRAGRHDRRTRLSRLRGDPRPREPRAADGDAEVGAPSLDADRARKRAHLHARRGGPPVRRPPLARTRRSRRAHLPGDHGHLRRVRRSQAARYPRAGADPDAVELLAAPRYLRARDHGDVTGRGPFPRLRGRCARNRGACAAAPAFLP